MDTRYRFGTLPLHGGTLALGPLPGLQGTLAADIARITGFAPALVLSLTAMDEMQAAGAAALPGELARRGIGWVHLPVADFSIPDPEAEARWPEIAARARAILGRGGKVFVHCKGGLGRSGMIALRLMIEAGEAPAPALARLRRARPGAVETVAQARWAEQGAKSDDDADPDRA